MLTNAKDQTVDNPEILPIDSALDSLYQPIKFFKVEKKIINFENYETLTPYLYQGVVQPMRPIQVIMKPEGQRDWRWYTIHAPEALPLVTDDIVYIGNFRYRVVEIFPWEAYGYYEYHVVQDFQTSPTSAPMPNEAAINKFLQDIDVTAPLTVTIDTSANIPDARSAVWALYDANGKKLDTVSRIKVIDASHVQITAPEAGRFRLIGES